MLPIIGAQTGLMPTMGIDPFSIVDAGFGGTNEYLSLAGALSAASNGDSGVLSMWLDSNAGIDGANAFPFRGSNGRVKYQHLTSNKFEFAIKDTGGIERQRFTTTSAYNAASGRSHHLISWDNGSSGNQRMFINDIDDLTAGTDAASGTLDYASSAWGVGSQADGTFKWNGTIGQFYLIFNAYLDFDTVANRRKFITAGGDPVDLGLTGLGPGLGIPDIFFDGGIDAWHTNKGDGGGFVENGTLF